MNYDQAKDEVLATLSGLLEQTVSVARTAFVGRGFSTRVKKIDYVAQVAVLNFPDQQPAPELIDVIGEECRHVWPEMPQLTATLFKVSKMNSDLILDLNAPSGIAALAEAGDIPALAAIADGKDVLKV